MNYRNISNALLMIAACAGCGDPAAFEPGFAEDELGTLQEALGESTCGEAVPTTTSNGSATLTLSAEQQDNSACRWGYVHQVNNVPAGMYFFTRWNDTIPLNDLSCASSSVKMDVYKRIGGAWVLDASRFDHGDWRSNACGTANVNRQVQSAGTYKIIVNGSYSALSPQFRSDIRVTSWRATL